MNNLFLSFLLLITFHELQAKQWNISNHPSNPGQYNNIQVALNDVNVMPGDTFLIHATGIRYPDFELNKKIVFIGSGYNTQNNSTQRSTLTRVFVNDATQAAAASGSKFYGLVLNYFSAQHSGVGYSLTDISFENCLFDCHHCPNESGIQFQQNAFPVNFLIKNCHFSSCTYDAPINFNQLGSSNTASSVTIFNSIFSNCGEQSLENFKGTMVVSNCTFLTQSPIENVKFATFQNCIFNAGNFMSNVTDNDFNNCIAKDTSLPPANNTGNNNISNTEVIFIPNTYMLSPSSPGYTGGNDGQQMGVYGGNSTFTSNGEPFNSPIIRSFNVDNTTIPQNGSLSIDLLVTKPLKHN